jgi:uncharacterized protein (TIGR00730 family)
MEHLNKAPKAYRNAKFLNSPAARTVRIMTEYLEPFDRLNKYNIKDTIVFFGSARIIPVKEARKNVSDIKTKLKSIKNKNSKDFAEAQKLITYAEKELEVAQYYDDAEELAYRLTKWSKSLKKGNKFVICSGGGPGIMEAVNKGAHKAKGLSIGFNISLPFEQFPNRYISPNLNFEFHYFFMRKFWFAYLAKALVVMPGGFGTMDELMELLTLVQTEKLMKKMPILMYGKKFWNKVINLEAMAEYRVISQNDLKLIKFVDTVDEAFEYLKKELGKNYVKN